MFAYRGFLNIGYIVNGFYACKGHFFAHPFSFVGLKIVTRIEGMLFRTIQD